METVKFELKSKKKIFGLLSSFIALILIILSLKSLSLRSTTIDLEIIYGHEMFLFVIYIIGFISLIFRIRNYLTYKKMKKKWGTEKRYSIEISKNKLISVHKIWDKVIIRTTEEEYKISKGFFIDQKALKNLPSYGSSNQKIYHLPSFYSFLFGTLMFIGAMISMISSQNGGKYDLKYLISPLRIKTIQIEGNFVQKKDDFKYNMSNFPQDEGRNQCILIDDKKVRLESPWAFKLADKIFNKEALKLLPNDTPIRIKIRKIDYENFIKTGKFDKTLRFYELEANGDILYQKRGLKEEFEVATF